MSLTEQTAARLDTPEANEQLRTLYGGDEAFLQAQKERYAHMIRRHAEVFGENANVRLISAPGRTEIGGNHTDHNNGRVLAASVNLDTLAAVTPRDDMQVIFHSEGYSPMQLNLEETEPREKEMGTTRALIRGVAAGMKEKRYRIGGFEAVVHSTVASGGGLSSSAALEVMVTGILDALYNRFDMPYTERAQISQMAENRFFGKPSGLLDQMASAAGGLVTVDFRDNDHPEVEAIRYDFAKAGYAPVVVATGGSHADLTDHYAAIPMEMKQVAAYFGRPVLRGITAEEILAEAGSLRKKVSDRAIMRALHFVREDERVPKEVAALKENRIADFLQLIRESGRSSFMYLQNVFADNRDQSLSLALCMAEDMLSGDGAWRVHGGGFAGTTLNFVPLGQVDEFVRTMNRAFGEKACIVLSIRPVGAAELKL